MGGDHGPAVVVPAVLDFLAQDPEVAVTLVGLRSPIESLLLASPIYGSVRTRIALHEASQLVSMEESPVLSLKNKKDSSLRVSINLVKSGAADCCVSAGNTGALMATARFVLENDAGHRTSSHCHYHRPPFAGQFMCWIVGANVDCAPEHLLQFGIMGSILATSPECPQPSVGLLNIGHEAIKGNEIIKRASELLRTAPIRFHGNVEGDDIYKGTVDVVVCDGFVGNVVLKTSEGLAWMLGQMIRTEFNRSFWTRLAGAVALPVLNRFKRRVDHRQYNGASLLGLRGLVVKSHGGADAYAFRHALLYAVTEVRSNVLGRIQEAVQERENLAS